MDWHSQAQQQLQQLNLQDFTASLEAHGITDRDYLQVHLLDCAVLVYCPQTFSSDAL